MVGAGGGGGLYEGGLAVVAGIMPAEGGAGVGWKVGRDSGRDAADVATVRWGGGRLRA